MKTVNDILNKIKYSPQGEIEQKESTFTISTDSASASGLTSVIEEITIGNFLRVSEKEQKLSLKKSKLYSFDIDSVDFKIDSDDLIIETPNSGNIYLHKKGEGYYNELITYKHYKELILKNEKLKDTVNDLKVIVRGLQDELFDLREQLINYERD